MISWDWIFAVRSLDIDHLFSINPEYSYEIQAFRLGDIVVVGWPGEPFVEAQLEVKLNAPAQFTIVGHLCNDSCGYQPTLQAFKRGGYETKWTWLSKGTLETVTERTVEIIQDLFA